MPSSPRTLATAPSSVSVDARAQVEQQFGQPPVGADAAEDLLVLYLAGHDGLLTPSLWKVSISRDSSPSESQCTVMPESACGAAIDLRVCLFADGGDHDGKALGPRRVEQQKRKASVAGDEAEFHGTHRKMALSPRLRASSFRFCPCERPRPEQ